MIYNLEVPVELRNGNDISYITVVSEDKLLSLIKRSTLDTSFQPIFLSSKEVYTNLEQQNEFILKTALEYGTNVVSYSPKGLTLYRINEQKRAGRNYVGVGVGIVIPDKKGRVILNLRSGTSNNRWGFWELPGGTDEMGDSLEQTVVNEAWQELGIVVDPQGCISVHQDRPKVSSAPIEYQHWISFGYVAKWKSGRLKNGEPNKFKRVGRFYPDHLPENTSVLTKKVLEEYKARGNNYISVDSLME